MQSYWLRKSQMKKPCGWPIGVHTFRAVKFCTLAPTLCEASVWNVFHVTDLAPRIFRWLVDFWQIFGSLVA